MPKIYNIVIGVLVLGLIYAELLPTVQATNWEAYSAEPSPPTQSDLLLSFFDPANKKPLVVTAPAGNVVFVNNISDLPDKLIEVAGEMTGPVSVDYTTATAPLPTSPDSSDTSTATPPAAVIYKPVPVADQPFLGDVIPQYGTPLFDAYATGGRAWYQEGNKVVVIFPDSETFRSFDKSTGAQIDWLQDRLSYIPLDSPGALDNYVNNYHGEIVAETKDWALVKFPSGGFLKIAKSTSTQRPFLSQQ